MRSRAHIKGHPIHAILITFPIAFLTGAFILDGLRWLTDVSGYADAAVYATTGGLIAGVIAAIPGLIDYAYSVPPASSASRRAAKHGILNGSVLLIFTFTLLIRLKSDIPVLYLLVPEGIGIALMTVAGWMGGTLVVRNQIGVDNRYADAGKWHEESAPDTGGRVEIKDASALGVNQMKLIRAGNRRIVVARTESGLSAFDDACTHRGGSLADGALICETVQCPWHGSQFHVRSGGVKAGPAKASIKAYTVEQEGERYWINL